MIGANFSEQEFIAKITAVMEANPHNEQFGFTTLDAPLGISLITLKRKVIHAAIVSVSQFISQVWLKMSFELQ